MPAPSWLAGLARTPLRTRRLLVRPLRRGDERLILPAVRESLRELARWLVWADPGYDLAQCRRFVRAGMRDFARGAGYPLIMTTHEGGFVGGCGFHRRGPADAVYYEIGYWCRTSLAGRGYTTEAVKALMRHAFRARDVHRIEIRCDPRNRASARVIEKCGLVKEGRLRKIVRDRRGRLCDHLVYAKVR
jgi:RimJ/RimL family protein N-acetyltransferase